MMEVVNGNRDGKWQQGWQRHNSDGEGSTGKEFETGTATSTDGNSNKDNKQLNKETATLTMA